MEKEKRETALSLASASPFFPAKGDEMPSKKCHILMSAVTFFTNGL